MTDYEMVSELVTKTGASYADAKRALDASGKDMLSAVIMLENEGRSAVRDREKFRRNVRNKCINIASDGARAGAACACGLLSRLSRNSISVSGEREFFSLPLIALIFLLPLVEVLLPAMLVSLFFGVSYRLKGPDFSKDMVFGITRYPSDRANTVVVDADYTCSEAADNGFFNK